METNGDANTIIKDRADFGWRAGGRVNREVGSWKLRVPLSPVQGGRGKAITSKSVAER